MNVNDTVSTITQNSDLFVLAGEDGIEKSLTLDRRDNHIIYLIFTYVFILVNDVQIATFLTAKDVLSCTPKMRTLDVHGFNYFCV